jgi:hypothetical protein
VRAALTDNEWIFLQTAVDKLDEPGRDVGSRIPPCLSIERAWRLGTVRLQGVRPPGVQSHIPPWGVLEEIDPREWPELSLDCRQSWAVYRTRKRVAIYEEVQARLTDIERLKREGEEVAAPAPPQGGTPSDTPGAGPRTRAVAAWLLKRFGEAPPSMHNKEITRLARDDRLGVFSLRTLVRARAIAWPQLRRARRD